MVIDYKDRFAHNYFILNTKFENLSQYDNNDGFNFHSLIFTLIIVFTLFLLFNYYYKNR